MRSGSISACQVVLVSVTFALPALADPPNDRVDLVDPQTVSACNVSAAVIDFSSGSARLTPDARSALSDIAVWAGDNPARSIRLRGMTDSSGGQQSNARLSERRAEAAKSYLTEQGIEAQRVTTTGHGRDPRKEDSEDRRAVAVVTCLTEPLIDTAPQSPDGDD